tara:strand:+ start:6428 stop:7003 length:576 start_codon:yes stop_codon:yes gene_type:complete
MKKIILLTTFLITALVTTNSIKAQDGFFSNAKPLEKGVGSIGLQPVFLTAQDDFMFIVRGGYGITNTVTGHLKLGLFEDETYFGGHFETALNGSSESAVDVAALTGLYTYGDLGLKLGLNLSTDFDPVSIYTGINYQPLFADETIHSVLIPIGFDLHLDNNIDLILEGNIPANNDADYLQSITFGVRVYLK